MGSAYAARMARLRVPLGMVLTVLYLVLAQPRVRILTAGAAVALIGLIIRGWAAGYLEKNDRLATAGPYARTRNPLYLGSLVIGAGFVLAGGSWILAGVFIFFFAAVYLPVIRREEAGLRQKFGEDYAKYAARVPLLFPMPRKVASSSERFRWDRYRKNREYEAALGYVGLVIILCIKMMLH